jgi:hypothetical protein
MAARAWAYKGQINQPGNLFSYFQPRAGTDRTPFDRQALYRRTATAKSRLPRHNPRTRLVTPQSLGAVCIIRTRGLRPPDPRRNRNAHCTEAKTMAGGHLLGQTHHRSNGSQDNARISTQRLKSKQEPKSAAQGTDGNAGQHNNRTQQRCGNGSRKFIGI